MAIPSWAVMERSMAAWNEEECSLGVAPPISYVVPDEPLGDRRPLHLAAFQGDVERVRELLNAGADKDQRSVRPPPRARARPLRAPFRLI